MGISWVSVVDARAAQVYLHARRERDREIASTLDKMAKRELKKPKKGRKLKGSGT
ncbi:hypothetical protein [Actinomadura spongiicola]|uniref:hypothetical protein n=1 Tax=Actinomadura spongiicola TaxID=2303421 RepID=UPI0013147DFF|nr:hypothetical protein [Actinomadura spongiicola]